MTRPRVLLADDHRLLREAFAQLLEPECDVVGLVADGRALLKAAAELQPDIVVVDIAMPLLNGLDAARHLKQALPGVKVIFLTVSEDAEIADEAQRIGASAYLLKNSAASELMHAIREVSLGRSYVTPLARPRLSRASRTRRWSQTTPNEEGDRRGRETRAERGARVLSPRQREVLQLLAEGHTMKKTARILKISPRTVAFHKYAIMAEFGIKSNAELIQFASKHLVTV